MGASTDQHGRARVTHQVTLRFGDFGWESLASEAKRDGETLDELFSRAVTHLAAESETSRAAVLAPRFKARDQGRAREIRLELAPGSWARLEREAGRQGISLEQLLEHAPLLYLADVDSVRVAGRPPKLGGGAGEPAIGPPRLPAARQPAPVMGLPFDRLDHQSLIRLFLEGARSRSGGWIVTPNLDILRQFSTNPESRELILAATHRVADGLPIVWASRLAGTPVPERVPGSDLVSSVPEAAARAGLSVFLLGGNPGVAAVAAERLEARHPGLGRVGFHCPPLGFEDDPREMDRIREALRRARPALVLVGLGFPKQERLIRLLRPELPEAWFIGVGIAFSFLAGDQPRAPVLLQRLGLEWTHRLWHEPRRLFRRYILQDLPFCPRLFAWALAHRLRSALRRPRPRDLPTPAGAASAASGAATIVNPPAVLAPDQVTGTPAGWER